jgi:hypothetical protein
MVTKLAGPRVWPWLLTGALAGALIATLDGVWLGFLFEDSDWVGACAAAGALLGAAAGGIARVIFPYLVLKPPDER